MKKLIFIGVMGLFVLGSCNSKNTGHEGHDHETVTHNHDKHEGHDHEAEGHDHEAEGADLHTKVNAAEDTITAKFPPANPPASTAMKSSSRKRKLTLPV